jgi:hypothetical protein
MFKISSEKKVKKKIMWGICIFGFIHTPGKMHYYVLSAGSGNFGRCPAPGKALAVKNIRLLVCILLFLIA